MPHTNFTKSRMKAGFGGKPSRKRKRDDEYESKGKSILQIRRNQKRLKTLKKTSEEEMLKSIDKRYSELLKKSSKTMLKFEDFPLSWRTMEGLIENDYLKPTEIQRDSLIHTLNGCDLVGAAKTGSGKTLAFVIPLLESLWRAGWSPAYGLGALVISPTRELALQTFNAINAVGAHHNFSCGLLIGGSNVDFERNRLSGINILVCTPGRLLQHMDENEMMQCDQLQFLVLDEADRMLDMGFAKQLDSIVQNLPRERQTLLFSATQTRNVKDLCRVCTKDPIFVSVHENATSATPDNLKQSFTIVEEHNKINTLWSFIVAHRKKKSLVFVSSCKQARFLTDAFSHLRPGLPVMGLWGTMNQTKRIDVFTKFDSAKAAVMIATDIASRGLDFEHIDWVIQMDCPAEIDDYIHRAGRSARMDDKGNSLLMLTKYQKKAMLAKLEQNSIPIEELNIDPSAIQDVRVKLRSMLTESMELKEYAQKSVVSYIRALHTMRNKKIFNVSSVDTAALADSYGLVSVPRIRFLDKKKKNEEAKNKEKEVQNEEKGNKQDKNEEDGVEDDDEDEEEDGDVAEPLVGKFNIDIGEEDLITKKNDGKEDQAMEGDEEETDKVTLKKGKPIRKALTKVKAAKKILNKKIRVNTKKVFGEDDEEVIDASTSIKSFGLDIEEAKKQLKETDKEDRKRFREMRKQKKLEKLEKKRSRKNKVTEDEVAEGDEPDLSWLPDPDEVRKRYSMDGDDDEDGNVDVDSLKSMEQKALEMLNMD